MKDYVDVTIGMYSFRLSKDCKNKLIECHFGKIIYSLVLSDREYNILKEQANKTLKNAYLTSTYAEGTTVTIYFELDILYSSEKEKYNIVLTKNIKEESTDVIIDGYTFTFEKTSEKIIMKCETKGEKYHSIIEEEKYNMFQDYKNGVLLKNITLKANTNSNDLRIIINMSFYGYPSAFHLYLNKQTSEDKLKEQNDVIIKTLKDLTERVAKLEKN